MNFALHFAWFAWQLFGPDPPIVVSKETTYLTAPLRADGLPDYERYILEKMRDGVTPENNAAVLFLQAMGPGDLEPDEFAAVAKEIGLKQIPSQDECLPNFTGDVNQRRIEAWIKRQRSGATSDQIDVEKVAEDLLEQAMKRPWTSRQIPPLAEWMRKNEKPLDLLVAASHRSKFYAPPVEFLNDSHDMLIGIILYPEHAARDAAKGLSARAMWRLGEGQHAKAWSDIVAVIRLSQLKGEGYTLVEELVSIAIQRLGNNAAIALLNSGDLPVELAWSIHNDLKLVPSRTRIGKILYEGERLFAIDSVLSLLDQDELDFSGTDDPLAEMLSVAKSTSNDWNECLTHINVWYNNFAPLVEPRNWKDRNADLAKHFATLERLEGISKSSRTKHRVFLGIFSRKVRASLFSDFFAALLMPAADAALTAEDRANTELSLTQLAAALAVYRTEHGEYPNQLESLVPDMIPKLPGDLFHNTPFAYRRTANGYLLYSFGPNGTDDAGNDNQFKSYKGYFTNIEPTESLYELLGDDLPEDFDSTDPSATLEAYIPKDADDIAIRVPLPKLVMPKKAE